MRAPISTLAPVQQAERIQIVDILRGFALFGILLVNVTIFSHPMQAIVLPAEWLWRSLTYLKPQPFRRIS